MGTARVSRAHAENLAYRTTVEAHPRGRVLEGELHLRPDGTVEEKMVDVACAVDVARHATLIALGRSRFDAVVMLSADRDLTPAYRMAVEEYGIALHVAAASIVETREYPYLLLGEAAFVLMCEPEPAIYGHALRNAVARLALQPRERWTLVAEHRGRRGCLMRHASGAEFPEQGLGGVYAPKSLFGEARRVWHGALGEAPLDVSTLPRLQFKGTVANSNTREAGACSVP
ncbi:MAG: hypothetical protein ACRDZO_17080 [Egibacteraceae bacterium]